VVVLVTLAVHGSLYLATKTEGDLNSRARKVASTLWPVQVAVTIFSLIASAYAVPRVLDNYSRWPVGYLAPIIVSASLAYLCFAHARGHEKSAFLASCAYIGGMLVGAAFALYPNVLPASTGQ
jgi:cytochrome d ubiquinol oxidase subunit II